MNEKNRFLDSGFLLVITSHALNHTYDSLLPVLYPLMITELGLSYGLVGILVMGYRLSSGALQLLMGFLGRFVRRKVLLGLGMIWQSVANCMVGVAHAFEHVFASRTLAGIGSSPQHPTGASYIAENFSKKQLGTALGLNIATAGVGRFVAPLLGSLLVTSLGWRNTITVFSVPGILVGVAFLFISEAKHGIRWSGKSSLSLLFKGTRQVLSDRLVLLVMVVEMVMAFRIGAGDFIPSFLVRNLKMSSLEAGTLFAIFVGTGIPAPYVWGYLSDRIERRKVVMLAMSTAAILWYLLPFGTGSLQLLLVLAPLGFACQGVGGVVQAFVAEATTEENRDLIYGIYFTLAFTLGSLSPAILGYLADMIGFDAGFSYVAAISLLAVVAAYFLK